MPGNNSVIDVNLDPLSERRRRRRALLRIGLPVAGVALMIVFIVLIAIYSTRANQSGVLALSDDLLNDLDGRIALAVASYLDPADRVVNIARSILHDQAFGEERTLAINYGAIIVIGVPQVEDVLFADADGNYLMVRHGESNPFDVKVVRSLPPPRRVTWFHFDASGKIIGQEDDPTDEFDPRTRPWFIGAAKSDALFWTGAYIFYTDRKPGLTVARRYVGADGRPFVFGADISLDAISKFLSSLQIGRTGQAFIIDGDGRLVASPTGSVMVKEDKGDPVAARLDELDDPVLTRAYDEYRVEGRGRHIVDVGGRSYIESVTPLANAGENWSVLIIVPQDDFVGFVASNNRNVLFMSLSVVAVAVLLAGLLIRQGVRADRNARLLADRQHALDRQSAAFASIAADASVFDPAQGEAPRNLTETLADLAAARRVGVWRLAGDRILHLEDSFERATGGHTEGLELHRLELPQFFLALLKGQPFEAADAARDPRMAEFYRLLLQPFGSRSLLVVPVERHGAVVGAISVEDGAQLATARNFVLASANMLASHMTAAPDAVGPRGPRAAATPAESAKTSVRSFSAELRERGTDPETLGAEIYSDAAVMVLRFTDAVAMAVKAGEQTHCLSNEIVCALQEVAAQNDITYLKIVGQEVIAAAGFNGSGAGSPGQIADAALAMRDRCIALFEDNDQLQAFRIGIDCGVAIGSSLGSQPRVFNLWGEAVHAAELMAASALPGTVQVTEAAYNKLRQDFLFRSRGRFYAPGSGSAHSFVLAGRL